MANTIPKSSLENNKNLKSIWISWENHRRTSVLAREFCSKLYIVEKEGILRFPLSVLETVLILLKSDAMIVFVQNPSMLLAGIATFICINLKKVIIIDRHSNFLLSAKKRSKIYLLAYKLLNKYSLRYANLTIVTNKNIADFVRKERGEPYILPDKIPEIAPITKMKLKEEINIFLISSFHNDEPYAEVFDAMNKIKGKAIQLYVSGNYKLLSKTIIDKLPSNITLTGFLDNQKYIDMLFSADIIMVLTKIENCMLCGCYEAIAAGKPLITSNKKVLKEYFQNAIFVDNYVNDIVSGILEMCLNLENYRNKTLRIRESIKPEWDKSFINLREKINLISQKENIKMCSC